MLFIGGKRMLFRGKTLCATMGSGEAAEPVAYLYGHVAGEGETPAHIVDGVGYVGAILPPLPEWDRETYPHAILTHNFRGDSVASLTQYSMSVSSKLIFQNNEESGLFGVCVEGSFHYKRSNGWGDFEQKDSNVANYDIVVWANFDVLNEDGSIYLEKSDRIPIYE